MPYDEAIADRVRRALAEFAVIEQPMFGGLAFLRRGHMLCCVARDSLLLRLGDAGADAAMARPHTRPVDFSGRPINSMIWVDPAGLATLAQARAWLRKSIAFVETLPAKKRRKRARPRMPKRGAKR